MHFKCIYPCYSYCMNGNQLTTIEEHKDLGILMDSELKFYCHSCMVTNKASQVLGIIKNLLLLDRYTLSLAV